MGRDGGSFLGVGTNHSQVQLWDAAKLRQVQNYPTKNSTLGRGVVLTSWCCAMLRFFFSPSVGRNDPNMFGVISENIISVLTVSSAAYVG